MQNLDLSRNGLTDSGIVAILKAVSETAIERLVISSNKLTDKCTDQVGSILSKSKHLRTLNMQDNKINDKNAKTKLVSTLKKIDIVI